MIPALPLFKCTTVSADAAVKAAAGRLIAVLLVGGSQAGTLILYDDPNSADGTVLLSLGAIIGDSVFVDLSPLGGKLASTGIYADIGGTGAAAYVWFE